MAFNTTEGITSYFTTNRNKIQLPRFQRKSTWTEKDNFKLSINVFKGYPIGVIIVNDMTRDDKSYLLDGRQRRNALLSMYEDPVVVYEWAKKFIGIKKGMSEETIRSLFREKIHIYLQSAFEESTEDAVERKQLFEDVFTIERINFYK